MELVRGVIGTQGLRNVVTLVQVVGVDARQILNACGAQGLEQGLRQLVVGLGDDFACVGLHNIGCDHATQQELFGHANVRGRRLLHVTRMACRDALVLGHHDLARLVGDVETCDLAAQTLGDKFHLRTAVHQTELVVHVEVRQNRFWR